MVSTQRRSRSPSSDVASRSLMARMPVSGVRTSWANTASAASTTPPDAGVRLCTLITFSGGLALLRRPLFRRAFHALVARFCRHDTPGSRLPHHGMRGQRSHGEAAAAPKEIYRRPRSRRISAGVGARSAQFAQTGRAGGLGKLVPGLVADQSMMPVGRLGQAEQTLQQAVHARGMKQVLAAHDVRDPLQRVVDHDREVIAGRRLLARQDDVAPGLRAGGDCPRFAIGAFALLGPGEVAGARDRRVHVEPQRIGRARFDRGACVRRMTAGWHYRGRAARRRDRAARRPPPLAAPPALRSRRGFRSSDRPGRVRTVSPPRGGTRRNAPIADGPAFPRRGRARRDPR